MFYSRPIVLLFALSALSLFTNEGNSIYSVDAFGVRGNSQPQARAIANSQNNLSLHAAAKKKDTLEVMRKKEFVATMAEELGYTKTDADSALTCALEIISDSLVEGKKVVLAGFGTFEPKTRSARKGRNPKTGEEIDIAASVSAGFSAAKGLKDKLNGRG